MSEKQEKYMASHLLSIRESEFRYAPFDREIAFYESICSGDMKLVKIYAAPLFCEGCGTLSRNYMQNLKYHFTITTAMIARFCINSGMSPDDAYSLSDVYIMRADECREEQEIRNVHMEMIEAYTKKMHNLKKKNIYSKRIICAMDYISEHLHTRIRINDVAEYLKISPEYLSRTFRAETGMTFTDYVNSRKVEEATGLLRYSEYNDTEISSILCFSSQSYFINIFKKYIGMTPKEYKKKYRFAE